MNKMKYHLRPVLFLRNMLFPFFQIFPNSLLIGSPAETSSLMAASGMFQPECRLTGATGKLKERKEKKNTKQYYLDYKYLLLLL